ncbi:MAG: hypothetical protein EBV30_06720 [Actinobacteria bacterium]|nr:hypothetical protein [Actinomycetota bacterium]
MLSILQSAYFDFLNKIEIALSITISTATMETMSITKPPPEEWRIKNAEVWDKIECALSTLSAEGMFASLECFTYSKHREPLAPPGKEAQIACTLYFRGTDVDAWKLDKSREAMRDSSGNCTFCGTHKDTPREDLDLPAHLVRGPRSPDKTNARFRCPIKFCRHWAPPSFQRKTYSGFFRAVYNGEAIFEGPCRERGDLDSEPMTNKEQIEAIKRVITEAFCSTHVP